MHASTATRAIVFASLIGLTAAAPPQIRTAPRPVMRNPNAPQAEPPRADLQFGSQDEDVAAVDVTVETGDDDLRSNSAAFLHIEGIPACVLKQIEDDAWANGSTHYQRCDVNGNLMAGEYQTLHGLQRRRFELSYEGRPNGDVGFQTQDNWDVTRVTICTVPVYPKSQVGPQPPIVRLIDVKGHPLARMTGQKTKFDLTAAQQQQLRLERQTLVYLPRC